MSSLLTASIPSIILLIIIIVGVWIFTAPKCIHGVRYSRRCVLCDITIKEDEW